MPHNEGFYYAAYIAGIGIYTLYTISVWRRRQSVALRRIALRRGR